MEIPPFLILYSFPLQGISLKAARGRSRVGNGLFVWEWGCTLWQGESSVAGQAFGKSSGAGLAFSMFPVFADGSPLVFHPFLFVQTKRNGWSPKKKLPPSRPGLKYRAAHCSTRNSLRCAPLKQALRTTPPALYFALRAPASSNGRGAEWDFDVGAHEARSQVRGMSVMSCARSRVLNLPVLSCS